MEEGKHGGDVAEENVDTHFLKKRAFVFSPGMDLEMTQAVAALNQERGEYGRLLYPESLLCVVKQQSFPRDS